MNHLWIVVLLLASSLGAQATIVVGENQKVGASDAASGDNLGRAIDIDGDTMITGAEFDDHAGGQDAGSAYIFVRNGITWTQQAKLIPSDSQPFDQCGCSVAIDGDTAVVGLEDPNFKASGAAYVFVRNGTSWTQQAKLTTTTSTGSDFYGFRVAIDGDTIAVSAYQEGTATLTNSGAVYVFVRNGTTWSEQARLTASDAADFDGFGWSVAVSGDTLVAGAIGDDHSGYSDAGSAYVFTRSGTSWTEQAKLTANDARDFDGLGYAADVDGDTVVIGCPDGAYSSTAVTEQSGSAYVFHRVGSSWSQQGRVVASDHADGDRFGYDVGVSGDVICVGSPYDTHNSINAAGSAYFYIRSSGSWGDEHKVIASDYSAGAGRFGWAARISGDTAAVGRLQADYGSVTNSGAAYTFVLGAPRPDTYACPQGGSVNTPAPGMLGNDGLYGGVAAHFRVISVQNPSANTAVVSAPADGSFVYTPPAAFSGNDTFDYSVTVDGTTVLASETVTVAVSTGNQPPVITAPAAASTATDTPVTFSSSNGNQISLNDPDVGMNDLKLTLTAGSGAITTNGTAGVAILAGANGSSTVTLQGPLTALNTSLDGLVFTPSPGFSGPATLDIAVDDLGNGGAFTPLTDAAQVAIDVAAAQSGGGGNDGGCSTDDAPPGNTWLLLVALLGATVVVVRRRRSV
ncbi:MAG: cadherin-like domain-containing protein [Planctomycetes bacterium]|nr:cadherin-like domain-containing protein [Planctomycetota bacterium]